MTALAALRTARASAGDAAVPPLVLLHAFPFDARMWADAARQVPGTGGVHLVDLPGTPGHVAGLPEPSLEASADAVARLLSDAGIDRAVVAGLSMGGYVALALAERHPGLVAGLGLVDTKSVADTAEAAARRVAAAHALETSGTLDAVLGTLGGLVGATTRTARPQVGRQVLRWAREQVPAGVAWSQRAMAARPDRTDVLRGFAGPVAVVVGDEDTVTPVDQAREMARASGGALVVVPRVGHLSAVEDPDAVATALGDLVVRVHQG